MRGRIISLMKISTQRQAVLQKIGVNNQLELMSVLRDLTVSEENID